MCQHISLVLPNRCGEFDQVTKVLQENYINVLGFQLSSQGDSGMLNVLCSPHEKAFEVLNHKYKYYCNQKPSLIVRTEHEPGSLMNILSILKSLSINVEASYLAVSKNSEVMIVLELSDRDSTSSAARDLSSNSFFVYSEQPE